MFDLDGVLLDSERLWDAARRQVVARHGGRWRADATAAMQGMSPSEWSAYIRSELGVDLDEARIVDLVVGVLLERYRQALPVLPGAGEALECIGTRWPLGLASSSDRVVIDEVLALSGWRSAFRATVSSEEVPRGKPHPDVYLEAARRLGVDPGSCVAVEDSTNGIKAAAAAGLGVVAVPNRGYPPARDALALAGLVTDSLSDLTVEAIERLDVNHVDEEEIESFPASDPHSDWAGP